MNTLRAHHDVINIVEHLGYSEREAVFLYTVGIYSGYFLRRHFNLFVQRERGAIATSFLRKAIRRSHVREIQCGPGRSLYQLHAKAIYRTLDRQDSQNRRPKSAREIRRRLIVLDYLLAHLGKEDFLDSEAARQKFFMQFGVKADALASAKQFGELLPISIRRSDDNLTVRFPFIDEGQRSAAKFDRFLRTHDQLLCSLPDFEVICVATSPHNFEEAHCLFDGRFPAIVAPRLTASLGANARFAPKQPRATFITELIERSYPPMLNPDPGYEAGQDWHQRHEQKSLFTTGLQNDTG